ARAAPFPRILASDRDEGAVAAARANAERAGVAERIEFSRRALSDAAAPPGPGWLVTNPPYGVRVSEGKDLRGLFARLGDVARGLGADWTVTMLSASPALARATGLDFDAGLPTLNGGLKVRLVSSRPR
ncbi:MAG: class I SAM-dependent RNA methyltransferase, partial [Elusimicrobia bacterium]|nr:class I SAM-dependent RNA methyltransferase [Elusimicrobiota bacterium]